MLNLERTFAFHYRIRYPFYFDNESFFVDPNKLEDVNVGDRAQIKDERNASLFDIIVAEKLTKIPYQHQGIKVRGTLGEIGRVQHIYPRMLEVDKINELVSDFKRSLEMDESETLEFKSSMLLDLGHYEQTNEKIIHSKGTHSVAKTVAAFANQHGGILYIGVKDEPREILGLKEDYELLTYKKTSDGFLIKLKNSMENLLEKHDFHQCVTERRILKLPENKEICVIKVKPSKTPLVVTWQQQKQLYVREGSDSILYENIKPFCNHWHEHMKELED